MSAMSFVKLAGSSWICAIGAAALLVVVTAPLADAGLLTQYDPNSQYGTIQGITPEGAEWAFTADLEYAVYHNSATALGLNFPGQYIYAYQLFNDDGCYPLELFSLGLHTNHSVANVGFIDPTGDSYLPDGPGSPDAFSVIWQFNDDDPPSQRVAAGGHSAIMYFTSPSAPGRASCSVVGGLGADVPEASGPFSPAPEPTTGGLLAAGAIALFFARVAKRRQMRGGNRTVL
jgi:hypothetical protein